MKPASEGNPSSQTFLQETATDVPSSASLPMPLNWTYPGAVVAEEDGRSYSVIVVDPMTRKLRIPLEVLHTSRAHLRTSVPSLCLLYLSGRCRQGTLCHQVHADGNAVQSLRASVERLPQCCVRHGDTKDERFLLAATAATHCTEPEHPLLQVAGFNWHGGVFPSERCSLTKGLLSVLSNVTHPQAAAAAQDAPTSPGPPTAITVSSDTLCRLHLFDRCRYAEDCKFLHVCKEWVHKDPQFVGFLQSTSIVLTRSHNMCFGGGAATAPSSSSSRHPQLQPHQQQQQQLDHHQAPTFRSPTHGITLSQHPHHCHHHDPTQHLQQQQQQQQQPSSPVVVGSNHHHQHHAAGAKGGALLDGERTLPFIHMDNFAPPQSALHTNNGTASVALLNPEAMQQQQHRHPPSTCTPPMSPEMGMMLTAAYQSQCRSPSSQHSNNSCSQCSSYPAALLGGTQLSNYRQTTPPIPSSSTVAVEVPISLPTFGNPFAGMGGAETTQSAASHQHFQTLPHRAVEQHHQQQQQHAGHYRATPGADSGGGCAGGAMFQQMGQQSSFRSTSTGMGSDIVSPPAPETVSSSDLPHPTMSTQSMEGAAIVDTSLSTTLLPYQGSSPNFVGPAMYLQHHCCYPPSPPVPLPPSSLDSFHSCYPCQYHHSQHHHQVPQPHHDANRTRLQTPAAVRVSPALSLPDHHQGHGHHTPTVSVHSTPPRKGPQSGKRTTCRVTVLRQLPLTGAELLSLSQSADITLPSQRRVDATPPASAHHQNHHYHHHEEVHTLNHKDNNSFNQHQQQTQQQHQQQRQNCGPPHPSSFDSHHQRAAVSSLSEKSATVVVAAPDWNSATASPQNSPHDHHHHHQGADPYAVMRVQRATASAARRVPSPKKWAHEPYGGMTNTQQHL